MNRQWYVYKNNVQEGPYNWEQLKEHTADGSLKKDDLVWTEGMEEWAAASNIADLFPAQVTPPPVPQQYKAKPPIPPALRKEYSAPAAESEQSGITAKDDTEQPQAKSGKSPLKIVAMAGGGIVVLAALIFAVLFILNIDSSVPEMVVSDIATSHAVDEDNLPIDIADRFSHLAEGIYITMKIDNIPEEMLFYSQLFYEDELVSENKSFSFDYTDLNFSDYYYRDKYFSPGNYHYELRASEDDQLLAEARFEVYWEIIPLEVLYPGLKIFRSEGLSFAYPQDYQHVVEDGIDNFYKAGLEEYVLFYFLRHDAIKSEGAHGNLRFFKDAKVELIESQFDGVINHIYEDKINIDGIEYPYIEIIGNMLLDNGENILNIVLIPEGEYVYSFTYIAHEDYYDTYLPVYADLMYTISFQQ